MNCQQVRNLKEAYVDGNLAEDRNRDIEAHLATCPHCAARVALARRIQQELGPTLQQAIGDPRLSPAAEARIRARLWDVAEPSSPQPAWLRWVTWGVAPTLALAAMLVLALVIWLLLTPQLPATQQAFITPPGQESPAPPQSALALRPTWTPAPTSSAQQTTVPVQRTRTVLPTSTPAPTTSPASPVATQTQPAAPTPTQPATVVRTPQPTQLVATAQLTPTSAPVTTPSTVVVAASTPTTNGAWERYLAGESVTCVTRHDAEIWAGTANGQVVHLDTISSKQTRYTLGEGLSSPISGLAVDAEGQVWAATLGQGMFVLAATDTGNGPSQRVYTAVNAGLSSKAVHTLIVDAAGTVWCGTADGFVNRLIPKDTGDGNAWQPFAVPDTGPDAQVTVLAPEGRDTLWVGVRGSPLAALAIFKGGGLYRLQVGDALAWKKVLSADAVGTIQAIFVAPDGRKWVATSPAGAEDSPSARGGGVVVWDGKDWTLFEALGAGMPSRRVTSVAVDARERTWIGTDKGLVVYEGTKRTVYQASKSGLASDNVRAIALDEDGDVWLATDAGLCHLAGR